MFVFFVSFCQVLATGLLESAASEGLDPAALETLEQRFLAELSGNPLKAHSYSHAVHGLSVHTACEDLYQKKYVKKLLEYKKLLQGECLHKQAKSVELCRTKKEQFAEEILYFQKKYLEAEKGSTVCMSQKNSIEREILTVMFSSFKDFAPGGPLRISQKFVDIWDRDVLLNTQDLLGGFMQGFCGAMAKEYRKTTCRLGRLSCKNQSLVPHVLGLRCNVITVTVLSVIALVQAEQHKGRTPIDVANSLETVFERLEKEELFAEKDTQDPDLLKVIKCGVTQAQVVERLMQETSAEYSLEQCLLSDDNAWMPTALCV